MSAEDINEKKHIYAAIGDSGNALYVNPEKLTVVAITDIFKPAGHNRIDFIQEQIEPLLDASVSFLKDDGPPVA